mmetsp:Transcript_28071/g.41348  ORF Transcript_28071/g.41348 Transcript_28071/m.41348 type:complete len:86 (-) Transcript_28071:915-1172(-)
MALRRFTQNAEVVTTSASQSSLESSDLTQKAATGALGAAAASSASSTSFILPDTFFSPMDMYDNDMHYAELMVGDSDQVAGRIPD